MLSTITECRECGTLLSAKPMRRQVDCCALTSNNDNSPPKVTVTIEHLSEVSGLSEDTLLHRLAMALCERNQDLSEVLNVGSATE